MDPSRQEPRHGSGLHRPRGLCHRLSLAASAIRRLLASGCISFAYGGNIMAYYYFFFLSCAALRYPARPAQILHDEDQRLSVATGAPDTRGFTLTLSTWRNTEVWSADISWIAIDDSYKRCPSGEYSSFFFFQRWKHADEWVQMCKSYAAGSPSRRTKHMDTTCIKYSLSLAVTLRVD